MNTQHYLHCDAPICMGDPIPDWKQNVIWYPGEKICSSQAWERCKTVQRRINRLLDKGLLKNPYQAFTYTMLINKKSVRPGIKGRNPNAFL